MRQVFLDLGSGVAGDMLVAGLVDAGAPREALEAALGGLLPGEHRWEIQRAQRRGFAATRFVVEAGPRRAHRRLDDVLAVLAAAPLTPRARQWGERAFRALAEAEARCHGAAPGAVEFHEVGAVDALVDVCGACALLDALAPEAVWASPVAVGSGTVTGTHGRLPVPAPATLELLRGMPVSGRDLEGERATPTGVALLRAWEVQFGGRPPAVVEGVGYGAGARDFADLPNLLRVVLERAEGAPEQLVELRVLVDDVSGEAAGAALEALHSAGAVEAYAVAALGKKGRPAFEVTVLCAAARRGEFEELCYRLLGTLGMRILPVTRSRRPRGVEERLTPLGRLPHKVRGDPGGESAKPEFEALRRRADELGLTPREALRRLREPEAGA